MLASSGKMVGGLVCRSRGVSRRRAKLVPPQVPRTGSPAATLTTILSSGLVLDCANRHC